MNRIVREHYPVSKLPEDLQKEFPGQDEVMLTIEVPVPSKKDRDGPDPPFGWGGFSRYRHLAKARYSSSEQVVAQIRALRDEWDERDLALNKLRDP